MILFITNMGQYAIRGYEVDTLDFLLKPVSYFAFALKLDKALVHARNRQTASLIAIESVSRVDDPEKRVAAVSVTARSGLLVFQFENYYEGTLTFDGDFPQATEKQDGEHGFGLRSIQYAVEKYGGSMTVHPEGNLFLLRMSIPIPAFVLTVSASKATVPAKKWKFPCWVPC